MKSLDTDPKEEKNRASREPENKRVRTSYLCPSPSPPHPIPRPQPGSQPPQRSRLRRTPVRGEILASFATPPRAMISPYCSLLTAHQPPFLRILASRRERSSDPASANRAPRSALRNAHSFLGRLRQHGPSKKAPVIHPASASMSGSPKGPTLPPNREAIGPSPGRQPTQECTSGSRPLVPDFGGNGHSHCRLGERPAGRVPPAG